MTGRPTRPEPADLEFTASVKAKELLFREAPETSVVFTGEPGHQSASGSDRTNLPDQVREEVGYQDIRVSYRIACTVVEPALLDPPEPRR